ncbi:MAG: CGNR zinc finger domain-containing protein [Blastocatellia bacterium]|nr:CGNR zinc finger domain-containing protein [Blastocatellia bacterium]
MNLKERPIARAKLIGGRLCLDFTNTVGGRRAKSAATMAQVGGYSVRDERLADYYDLLAWSLRVGLLTEAAARKLGREAKLREAEAAAVWERAVALREAIYRISLAVISRTPPRASDRETLNRELAIAHDHVELAQDDEGYFVWRWDAAREALDQMLWRIADSAAEMLTAGDLTRLHQCGGQDCGWLFEDTSRNRSRQWCDMKDCGNLAKVRRFRLRSKK